MNINVLGVGIALLFLGLMAAGLIMVVVIAIVAFNRKAKRWEDRVMAVVPYAGAAVAGALGVKMMGAGGRGPYVVEGPQQTPGEVLMIAADQAGRRGAAQDIERTLGRSKKRRFLKELSEDFSESAGGEINPSR